MKKERVIERLYEIGVYKEWWKMEKLKKKEEWENEWDEIKRKEKKKRGIVVMGIDDKEEEIEKRIGIEEGFDIVKGFEVGSKILEEEESKWMRGKIEDEKEIEEMEER